MVAGELHDRGLPPRITTVFEPSKHAAIPKVKDLRSPSLRNQPQAGPRMKSESARRTAKVWRNLSPVVALPGPLKRTLYRGAESLARRDLSVLWEQISEALVPGRALFAELRGKLI